MVDLGGIGSVLSGLGAFGGLFGGGGLSGRKAAALEFEYAKRLRETEIQDRVKDARAAGVHPLFALGANVSSPPISVAGGGDSAISRISDAGQSIGRAASAFADSRMRTKLFEQEVRMNELKIKDAEISLTKNASDLAVSRSGLPPGLGAVDQLPSKSFTNVRGNRGIEAGIPPGSKGYVMPDGHTMMLPSPEAAEAMEDNLIYGIEHYLRNRVISPLMWGYRNYFPNIPRALRRRR